MKKLISMLVVLAILVSMTPAIFASESSIPDGGVALTLGSNDLMAESYALKQYYYIAETSGTLYVTICYFGYEDYDVGADLLECTGWVQLSINGELVTAMEQTLEVSAGDLVNITLNSVDGDSYFATINLSYDSFLSNPAGSEQNPVEVQVEDLPAYTLDIPAGEELYYKFEFDFFDYTLYIYGENAYIVVNRYNEITDGNEPFYIYAVDGVLTYDFSDGLDIRIGNAGDEAASFLMETETFVGIYNNPDALIIGEQSVNVPGDYNGYWYRWTASAAGSLTITVTGDNWGFDLSNETAGEYIYRYAFNGDSNVATLDVSADDVVMLNLLTIGENGWGTYPGGLLTVIVEFVPSSGEENEEDLTLYLENNYIYAREGMGDPATKEFTYVAEASGTLYITFRSVGCFGNRWDESSLTDEYYLEGFSLLLNGQQVTAFRNSLEVTEGETVVITIASIDGYPYEANVWLSYEGFYEESVGNELNPVKVAVEDLPLYTVDIPAGQELYYKFAYDFYDYTLYIYGEDAYIVVNRYNYDTDETEPAYIYAEDGVVTYDFSDGLNIRIGNAGDATATFLIEGEIPVGIYNNPDTLIVGEQTVNVAGDYNGYWYSWSASTAGTLTITVTGDNWGFEMSNYSTYEYFYQYAFENDSNVVTVEVSAGDVIMLNLLTIGEDGWGDYPGGELTVSVEFTPAEGGEEPEVLTGDVNDDGTINVVDAMLILQYCVGDITENDLNMAAADVNFDGTVNVVDAMLILQYCVGDIDSFEPEN